MEPLTINRKESKLRVAPEWADVCFTCGTCAETKQVARSLTFSIPSEALS